MKQFHTKYICCYILPYLRQQDNKKSSGVETMAQKKQKTKHNAWKIISIIFIVVFVVILIGGLLRAYYFRTGSKSATPAQMELAKTVALSDLKNNGENITGYTVQVSNRIRMPPPNTLPRNITEVLIYNQSVRYNYIIDADTGKILVSMRTEFNDGLNHSNDIPHERMINYKGFFGT